MKREDVLKLFPEATSEQINALLNQHNSEVATEKEKSGKIQAELDSLKDSAVSAEELQAKIDEINQSKMTETEKITADFKKELDKANKKVAELEHSAFIQNQRASAAEKFKVTAEQAKQIIKDDGTFDYDILGQIISGKEEAAANAKEQEIASASGNPGGQGGAGDGKSSAVKMVEKHFSAQAATSDIIKNYI